MAPLSLLTPLLVTRTFGADPWFLTMNEIVFFLGNIFGGVLISIWGGFKNRISTIIFASALCGIFSILIGLPISFPIYLVINLGIGLVMPFFNTPLITIFQLEVDPEKIGRVFSLVSIVSGMIMPLAMILFGPLADVISIQFILIITGIFFLVGAILLKKDKVLKNYVSEKNDDV